MKIQTLKFGTDGWRAIIADDYTVANVARVAKATAIWIRKHGGPEPKLVIGFDCRFGGKLFAETAIKVIAAEGIKIFYAEDFVSTPMISLAAKELNCFAGVIITASHNPPSYNGFKIKSGYGGPAVPSAISEVESYIPDYQEVPSLNLQELRSKGLLESVNLEEMYFSRVEQGFDLKAIRESQMTFAYDAMYGAGQRMMPRILQKGAFLHCEYNPSFYGQAPEPIDKNLQELSNLIRTDGNISIGVANDGDADRIGLYDNEGKFIDAHHIILLLIHILHKYKKLNGKVVIAFSVSDKVKKLCAHYGLEVQVTKIGFKYICEIMKDEDVLLGGEESGGIAVKGHIPERDGIWDALVILEHMAKSGKGIKELIREVYDIVGAFSYNRNDLHITEELKQRVLKNCEAGTYQSFGDFKVERVENIDGYKFHLNQDACLMIRASGTEPVLRVYGEATSEAEVNRLLKQACDLLLAG